MDKLRLKNMVFYGHHGVSEEERVLGGQYSLDITVFLADGFHPVADKLTSVYDYQKIYEIARFHTVEKQYKLIESLGTAIVDDLQKLHQNLGYILRLRKHQLPIKGIMDCVEVEINREPIAP